MPTVTFYHILIITNPNFGAEKKFFHFSLPHIQSRETPK
jgi:hypothetical protein